MADASDYQDDGAPQDDGAGESGGTGTREVKDPKNGWQEASGALGQVFPVVQMIMDLVGSIFGCGKSNDQDSHVEYGELAKFDVGNQENWTEEQRQAVQDLQDAGNALNGDYSNLSAMNGVFDTAATAFNREDLTQQFHDLTQQAQDIYNGNENQENENTNEQENENENQDNENENQDLEQ
ncbi:hypothetical protein HDU97_004547 [Phlyctochytrium planicorne]|nr:hypothetical protein HDU97_004547 [Phlyctochytrium planicorne]